MINLPAVCKKCGLTFPSGIAIGNNCSSSSFKDNKTSCPQCGSISDILDCTTDTEGKLHFSKSAYEVLSNPAVANDTLEKLKVIIATQQKSETKSAKTVIETIKKEIPELDGLTNLLTPQNAGEFYSMLGFILTLILFIQAMRSANKQPNTTVINNYYGAPDYEQAAYQATYESGGLKRKDICPCGSGKKFKNCHGD